MLHLAETNETTKASSNDHSDQYNDHSDQYNDMLQEMKKFVDNFLLKIAMYEDEMDQTINDIKKYKLNDVLEYDSQQGIEKWTDAMDEHYDFDSHGDKAKDIKELINDIRSTAKELAEYNKMQNDVKYVNKISEYINKQG